MITVIANLKGGSGKSTLAFNLAVWLEKNHVPVIGYDLDPQCTFSDLAMLRRETGRIPEIKVRSLRAVLARQLLAHQEEEVIVDVGAANMAAMKEAMNAADRILLPVPPSQPDVWATQRFLNIIPPVSEDMNTSGSRKTLAFVNRADTDPSIPETAETLAALHMLSSIDEVLPQQLHLRSSYRRSLSEGLAVFEMWPQGEAAAEFHALASALYPAVNHYSSTDFIAQEQES